MKAELNIIVIALFIFAGLSCNDDNGSPDFAGATCETADACYPAVNRDDLTGEVVCMDRVEDGYCTHTCDIDDDCCAVDGECVSEFDQVCAPFESTTDYYCFLTCEGVEDPDSYCRENAHADFICRSTGGGTDNRKVCMPQ